MTREEVLEMLKRAYLVHGREPDVVFWPKGLLPMFKEESSCFEQDKPPLDYGDQFEALGCRAIVAPVSKPVFCYRDDRAPQPAISAGHVPA